MIRSFFIAMPSYEHLKATWLLTGIVKANNKDVIKCALDWPLVRVIRRLPVVPHTKGPVMWKVFSGHDVTMLLLLYGMIIESKQTIEWMAASRAAQMRLNMPIIRSMWNAVIWNMWQNSLMETTNTTAKLRIKCHSIYIEWHFMTFYS